MIDVSSYQGAIDWRKAHDDGGVRHAYIKFGQLYGVGSYGTDPYMQANVRHARDAGVQLGLYWYARPHVSPIIDARWFLRHAEPYLHNGDLPPALDFEVSEGHDWNYLNDWKAQWFAAVDGYTGVRSVFYSYYYFWKQMRLYPDRPVWGAALGKTFSVPATWAIHQYSFTGVVPGVSTHVDLDRVLHDVTPLG